MKPNLEIILIYVTCNNRKEAEKIGRHLLVKRLCGCINIFPVMHSIYYWPSKSNTIEEADESVLIIKTKKSKYSEIEKEIHKIHHSDTPCIFSIKIDQVNAKYYQWLVGEISETA